MQAYIDTNVFIYALLKDPQHGRACERLLDAVQRGKVEAWTSNLTVCEVHNVVRKKLGQREAREAADVLISMPITLVPIELAAMAEALHLCTEHDLTIYDGIHAASATIHGIKTIISYDKAFDRTNLVRTEP